MNTLYFTGYLISLRGSLGSNLGDGTLLDGDDGGGCFDGSEERKQKELRFAPSWCVGCCTGGTKLVWSG